MQVVNSSSRAAGPAWGCGPAGGTGAGAHACGGGELRELGIHVALVVVNGPIESPKTAAALAGMEPGEVNDQQEIAGAVPVLARQGVRGRANELTLTPGGRPPAVWSIALVRRRARADHRGDGRRRSAPAWRGSPEGEVEARALSGGISNVVLAASWAGGRAVLKQSLPKLRVASEWVSTAGASSTSAAA